jgi:GT2 family glycosyltransferase
MSRPPYKKRLVSARRIRRDVERFANSWREQRMSTRGVLVSVCIVNYNNRALLTRCLDSVFEESKEVSLEVLVADNGSTDDSVAWLKRAHPEVRLFENGANLGFGAASNQLIRASSGEHLLLLNNDCVLSPDCLQQLLLCQASDRSIGITGCRVLTGNNFLQPTCDSIGPMAFLLPNLRKLMDSHFLSFGQPSKSQMARMRRYELRHGYDRVHEADFVAGVCMLIRRAAFQNIGELDENFFLYYEDVDYCMRARRAGWKVVYTPFGTASHFVQHKGRKSAAERVRMESWWSAYYFVRKHYGRNWASALFLRYFFQSIAALLWQGLRFSINTPGWRWKALARIWRDSPKLGPARMNNAY